jgi:hypothetical protein
MPPLTMQFIPPILQRPETWIKQHERMIITVLVGLVLWFAIGKIDTLVANHDNANLQQAKVVAQAQIEKNAALAAQAAQQAAQFQALAEKVQAQNTALAQANVALVTALTKQQKTDATLPPTQLVARLNTLVPEAGASVTPNGVTLPENGAVATVQELEKVPVLTTQLSDTQTELKNEQGLLMASTAQVATLNSEVASLKLEAVDQAKVCTAQIAVVKAEARRSKRRWFLGGFVAGWLSRQAVKTYTGF